MSTTLEEITQLADVSKFLEDQELNSTHGQCHTALTWLAIQAKRKNLAGYDINLCQGLFAGRDHSWMQIEDVYKGTQTIVDMTVDQFAPFTVPYIGPISPGYELRNAIALSDENNLQDFIENLG